MSCIIWMLKAGTQKKRYPGIPDKHIINQADRRVYNRNQHTGVLLTPQSMWACRYT